jgi:hypothetical protein
MRRTTKALASIGWSLAALVVLACSGDDTDTLPGGPDSGVDASNDATIHVGADAGADAGEDAAEDSGVCIPYDGAVFSDAEVQAGYKIVVARGCQQCHGLLMQGSSNPLPSTNAEGGLAYAPDLTPDPVNGLGCWTNAQIELAFLNGIDNEGDPLCSPMPHWGEVPNPIDDAGAEAVLAYLRNLATVINPTVPNTGNCPSPEDAGPEDAGPADAGPGDAATDAGSEDAGPGDAGSEDAGPADAGDEDSATDAGLDATADANVDAGSDAASDAGADADAG